MKVGITLFDVIWTICIVICIKSPSSLAENVTNFADDELTRSSDLTTPTTANLVNGKASTPTPEVTTAPIGTKTDDVITISSNTQSNNATFTSVGTKETESTSIPIVTTSSSDVTTKKPSCMKSRAKSFEECFNKLGDNAMKHFDTGNITEFLDDLCNPNISRPHVECIKEHFKACPPFLDTFQVEFLQFGPYHIKDITYFHSVDHLCDCSLGLVCVQKLNELKKIPGFETTYLDEPLVRVPNYKALCTKETGKYIGCLRKNIDTCKFALFQKYPGEYTISDVEEIKRMYDFQREHCDTINAEGFDKQQQCIEETSTDNNYNRCLRNSIEGSPQDVLCRMRDCVHTHMDDVCHQKAISIYIDAVNIYRHDKLKMLNFPCSSAIDVGFSVLTIICAIVFVVLF